MGIHLLPVDLHPPGRRDPRGLRAAIWEEVAGQEYSPPADKPRTLASYEADLTIRAHLQPVAVTESMVDMPLFLEPRGQVPLPLEASSCLAFDLFRRRWRSVLE